MKEASCEFVLRLYALYHGCPPIRETALQQGIVMEYMRRGSVQSLLDYLRGPPPWPLTFRLAHEVALGMNFLHIKKLIHHDLKPSNVLLSDELHAKIADFGLSRVSTSALNSNRETTGVDGGSYKYMPPEAFEASYKPCRAFDRYSYGILLWSIVTGKDPYSVADYSLVALRIPMGDRPDLEEIDQTKADGLEEIVKLMKSCWDKTPSARPEFKECLEVTENVLSKHRKGIRVAVNRILKRLESPTSNEHSETFSFPHQRLERSESNDVVDVGFIATQMSSMQDSVSVPAERMIDADKAKFVDEKKKTLIQDVSDVMAVVDELDDMVHSETYSVIEAEKTSQGKMRALYTRTLRSGGEKVKAAFYDALKKHQPHLVERLGG
ncbi:receptor-interacting serine/threonine-protein kinase 3 isoform X2 [Dicentrarchus labrax]|nr:receptor-interacting serine/threonine-protein kinase 3 isoform X2 [Dicentrarchus labrax]